MRVHFKLHTKLALTYAYKRFIQYLKYPPPFTLRRIALHCSSNGPLDFHCRFALSTQHSIRKFVSCLHTHLHDSCNLMYDRFCILCLRHSLHFISFISILLASELLCRVWSPPHFSSFQYYTVYSYICFYICCCIVFVIV